MLKNNGITITLKSFGIGVLMEVIFALWWAAIISVGGNWLVVCVLIPTFVAVISSFIVNRKVFNINVENIKNKNSIKRFVYQLLGIVLFFFAGYFLVDKFKLIPYLGLSNVGEYGERVSWILSSESWIFVLGFLFVFILVDYLFTSKERR